MADTHGIVVEDIVRQMAVGLKVYDVNGARLGTVQDYNTDTGWMLVDSQRQEWLTIPAASGSKEDTGEAARLANGKGER